MFRLDLACAHERMALLMNGYEDEATDCLAGLYPGGYVLDIGANVGLVTVPLALRTWSRSCGREQHVIAFEAMPGNYASLCANLQLNEMGSHVRTHRLGLGNAATVARIEIEGGDSTSTGTANVLPASASASGRGEEIEIVSLDVLRSDGRLPGPVTVVKLDTDGYDLEILKGGRGLLASDRPIVLAELNAVCLAWHGQSLGDAVSFLDSVRYDVWPARSAKRPLRFRAYRETDAYDTDCLLVPRERAGELRHLRADV